MHSEKLKDSLRLRSMYEKRLGCGPFPTSEVTRKLFPEPAAGTLHMYFADVAGIASHGKKLLELEPLRRAQFRKLVAESLAQKWPHISQQITTNETPRLRRLMDDTEEARLLIQRVLED